jgi:hypothetical protein
MFTAIVSYIQCTSDPHRLRKTVLIEMETETDDLDMVRTLVGSRVVVFPVEEKGTLFGLPVVEKERGMQLIIEHGNTKRRIEGPFNICGTAEDLQWIADCIHVHLTRGAGYGWVKITGRAPIEQCHLVNTEPSPWDTRD